MYMKCTKPSLKISPDQLLEVVRHGYGFNEEIHAHTPDNLFIYFIYSLPF